LHKSSTVGRLQEGVSPRVENIVAIAGILTEVAEDVNCP